MPRSPACRGSGRADSRRSRRRWLPPPRGKRRSHHQHRVGPGVVQERVERAPVALRRRVADDIDRIAVRPGGRGGVASATSAAVSLLNSASDPPRRSTAQDPCATTVGQDHDPPPGDARGKAQRLRRSEQLAEVVDTQQAGPAIRRGRRTACHGHRYETRRRMRRGGSPRRSASCGGSPRRGKERRGRRGSPPHRGGLCGVVERERVPGNQRRGRRRSRRGRRSRLRCAPPNRSPM